MLGINLDKEIDKIKNKIGSKSGQIIVYGAGVNGKELIRFLRNNGYHKIIVADKKITLKKKIEF